MATSSFTAAPTSSTNALFRLWGSALDTAITTVGLTDTAATGQIDFVTVAAPGAINTFMGFKVYRFSDALQATAPCFIKVEFGSSNGAAAQPALRVTVGTVHDGAGTITGTQTSGAIQFGSQASSATVCQCWASGDTGRLSVAMFAENTAVNQQLCFLFGVERSKNSAGADDSSALILQTCGYGSTSNTSAIRIISVPPSGGVPPAELRWVMPYSRNAVGASTFNNTVAMGLAIPFLGAALRPVLNFGAMNATDVPVYAGTIAPTVYGAAHTYISLGTAQAINQCFEGETTLTTVPVNVARMLMRYE